MNALYAFERHLTSSEASIAFFSRPTRTDDGTSPGELAEEPLQFVLKSRRLADGYRQFFRFMWESIPEG